jgi:hypothetical protein
MTKAAQPTERLKNKGFLSFFAKYCLSDEEVIVL